MTFIDERRRYELNKAKERELDYMIGRLNTFYIMKSFGAKLDKPEDLYQLNNDKEKPTKTVDPFSSEANAIFDKMDKATNFKAVGNKELIKEFKIAK